MSEVNIIEIEHGISYITPSESPLSSNVVVIEGSDDIWLYDCLLYTSDAADD